MSTEADLQLIYEAAAKTPCLNPSSAPDVAAWIVGASLRMTELQAKLDHVTTCYQNAEREIAGFDGTAKDMAAHARECWESGDEVRRLVRSLFNDYLDVIEESDSGREFRPITIGCCRVAKVEPLNQLLKDLRVAVGLPPVAASPAHETPAKEDLTALRADLQQRIERQCGTDHP